GICYTPSRSSGKVDGVLLASVESHHVKLGPLSPITDAGGNREAPRRRNRDAIRLGTSLEDGPRLKAGRINKSQACRPAVGDDDNPVVGDNAGGFWEARQCCDMPPCLVVDHLDAVAPRMRDEDAAALRIEGPMIEGAACGARDLDCADCLERHDISSFCPA